MLYLGYCVQWTDEALVIDKTSLSGLDTIEDAFDCKYGCSLWQMCAQADEAYLCEEAA